MGLFDKMFGRGASEAEQQQGAQQRFNELKQKYQSVLNMADQQHIQFPRWARPPVVVRDKAVKAIQSNPVITCRRSAKCSTEMRMNICGSFTQTETSSAIRTTFKWTNNW